MWEEAGGKCIGEGVEGGCAELVNSTYTTPLEQGSKKEGRWDQDCACLKHFLPTDPSCPLTSRRRSCSRVPARSQAQRSPVCRRRCTSSRRSPTPAGAKG